MEPTNRTLLFVGIAQMAGLAAAVSCTSGVLLLLTGYRYWPYALMALPWAAYFWVVWVAGRIISTESNGSVEKGRS